MKSTVYVNMNYGVVQKGLDYPVLSEGRDFYRIKCHGSPIYVPKFITGYRPSRDDKPDEEDEEN